LTKSQLRLSAILVSLAIVVYAARWVMFPGEALHNEMWRFLIGDVGFALVDVVLVTVLIDQFIQQRERAETKRKLNMVIGAFFSEMGTGLLSRIATLDEHLCDVRDRLVPSPTWTPADYASAKKALLAHPASIALPSAPELEALRDALTAEKPFILNLLGNQSLLEHESFTDLLWAVTHLAEELAARPSLREVPEADAEHLSIDTKRVYDLLVSEWLDYMSHLQRSYPYLFSLASRTNPFGAAAAATVER
jgi:hypothetical protein